MTCGSYTDNKKITPEQCLGAVENNKGKKRAGGAYRSDMAQHRASQLDMASRDFPLVDVYRETISGTYSEDKTPFVKLDDIKALHGPNAGLDNTSLDYIRLEFPGNKSLPGLLMRELGTDGVTTDISTSSTPDFQIVRYKHERIVMREVLLDAEKDFCFLCLKVFYCNLLLLR